MAREKTFIVTSNNQYIQSIALDAGRHTFTCNVKSHAEKLTVGFQTEGGSWVLYNIPITPGVWNKRAKLTFVLVEKTVRFSLCAADASTESPIYIQLPMLEEGSNASTPKANERDIEEDVADTKYQEFIFTRTEERITPDTPETSQIDDYEPENWHDDPISITEEYRYVWVSQRVKIGNTWSEYSEPSLFSYYSFDGHSPYIGANGNWYIWDDTQGEYVDSGDPAHGDDGKSPRINDSGNWEVWDGEKWVDTGIRAQGEDGEGIIIADFDDMMQSVSANSDGTVTSGLPLTAIFSIHYGTTLLTLDELTIAPITGVTASANKDTGVVTITAIAASVADTIRIAVTGKATYQGRQYERTIHLSINKVKPGADGESSVIYSLQPSVNVIKRNSSGVADETSIYCRVMKTDGEVVSVVNPIPFGYILESRIDDAPGVGYTPGTNIAVSGITEKIQWRLYRQIDRVVMIDQETVYVVRDGGDGEDGEDGRSPYIGTNGNWWVWDDTQGEYVDSGDPAHGDDGKSPYIGTNGNWYAWDGTQWVDTGIKAIGEDGEDGIDGVDGDPGVTLILSNESHTFAGSATTALAGSTNTTILAFKGTQQIAPTSVTINTSDLPTGMTRTINGSVITFTVTTSMTSSSGVIPITVVIDGKTFTLQFSYAIAFKGTDGLSKGIYLNAGRQIIKYNAAGTPTPSSNFTVVGTAVNTTISTWQYSVNGGTFSSTAPAGVTRSGNTVTINPTTITFNTLSIRASDGAISDTITIAAVRDGLKGEDGASTEWGYLLNNIASTPAKPTGSLPNGGWLYTMGSISASNQYLWISSRTKPAGSTVWGAWSNATLHARWPKDGEDGLPGLPGQIPVQKEWVVGDRHRNSDKIVDYIYVRGSNSESSYWYQLINSTDIDGIVAGAPPSGGVVPTGYKAVSWMKSLSVKTLIAEEANLANLIFKEGKLISIKGATFAGEEINYGDYTEYNFANTVSQPAVASSSWTELPSGTLRWVRYRKNTESSWTVKQVGTSEGQWTLQFATAPEGETWYSAYSTNRFWARVRVGGEDDYGFPFKITTSGGYDFIPNAMIDGVNGIISGEKVIAANVRNKIYDASSYTTSQIEGLLSEGKSVSFSTSGVFDSDYAWYTINLPNNRDLAGSTLTLHMPTGSVKRYRIKPGHVDGLFYTSEPLRTLNQIQVVPGVRGTIELKAVWDDLIGSLDWHILSQSRYMLNTGSYATEPRIPPYFLPNELIFNGRCAVSDSTQPTISKSRQLTNALIQVVKVTSGATKKIRIIVPVENYHGSTGGTMYRPYDSDRFLRLEADTSSSLYRVVVTSYYDSQVSWEFEVTIFNASNVQIYTNFNFRIFTNDYFIQSPWMGNNLNEV